MFSYKYTNHNPKSEMQPNKLNNSTKISSICEIKKNSQRRKLGGEREMEGEVF